MSEEKKGTQEPEISREERIRRAKELMAPKQYEERIAIMVCKKSADHCIGSSCMWAFHEHFRSFEQYKDRPAKLWAMFHCGGCDIDRETDPDFRRKIDRLKDDGVFKVHLGVCIRNSCPHIRQMCDTFDKAGIPWEIGTH